MKIPIIYTFALFFFAWTLTGCREEVKENRAQTSQDKGESISGSNVADEEIAELHLSDMKFNSLGINLDTLPTRALSGIVEANGQLEVPPQHQATVTAILGANVTSIKVIEGDKVKKGQPLAYVSHPNLTRLQTEYIKSYSRWEFLEKEMQRQKRLYDEKVGSGKLYQEIQADYRAVKGEVNGLESQLKQLSLKADKIRNGDIYQFVPVVSPIDGFIEKVKVKIGQYVDPQKAMFIIVNTEHIHADLMVFEKDVYKVKKGQQIDFTVESIPGTTLSAEIYSVGRQFEQNPKAVHVHAEIKNKEGFLIPGMYINGRIHTENEHVKALPEEAIIEEDGTPYIFKAKAEQLDGKTGWSFSLIEIRTGISEDGWIEINLLEPLPAGTKVAWNNGYYLISEMKKSQTSHKH